MPIHRSIHRVLLVGLLGVAATASAQNFDALKSKAGGLLGKSSGTDGSSLLGGLGSGSVSPGTAQNAAGVLGYCQQNGYLPSAGNTIKEKLLGSVGGEQQAAQNAGYKQGLAGVLQGSNGKTFDLSSLKGTIGKKVCSALAKRAASSFLGGK